ncbi:MAG: hypothetical protein GXO93_02490 [FCB group bacterium]|nr:hypothetical protein [FCB group bacterium]
MYLFLSTSLNRNSPLKKSGGLIKNLLKCFKVTAYLSHHVAGTTPYVFPIGGTSVTNIDYFSHFVKIIIEGVE